MSQVQETARCYECGRRVPWPDVRRRSVAAGGWLSGAGCPREDLCPRCAARIDREGRLRLLLNDIAIAVFLAVLALASLAQLLRWLR